MDSAPFIKTAVCQQLVLSNFSSRAVLKSAAVFCAQISGFFPSRAVLQIHLQQNSLKIRSVGYRLYILLQEQLLLPAQDPNLRLCRFSGSRCRCPESKAHVLL